MGLATQLRTARDLFAYHRARSAAFAEHDYRHVYLAARERIERALGREAVGLRMLDVGAGQRTPATALFQLAGNQVTGIDTELLTTGPGVGSFLRVLRANGVERAAKTLVRQILFDPAYDRRLGELAGRPIVRRGLDLRQLSVTQLPFPDFTFDAVVSNAVFEHLPNVRAAVDEVTRVLKRDGVCHIGIHLFPSLSGGHHMGWAFPAESIPPGIPPWDHLRGNRFPAHVYLNQLKESDYRAAFAAEHRRLEILDWITTWTEGEELLTPEIEAELAGRYRRDELLKREIVVIARRRP
jgi:SAM-dependent methyltransferase